MPYVESMMDPSWQQGRSRAWDAEESRSFNTWPIRYYLCPAGQSRTDPGGYGLTHYVGIAGLGADAPLLPLSDGRVGVFGYERQTRLEDIKDGRDTTLLLLETGTDNGPWAAAGHGTVRGLAPDDPPYLGQSGQFSSRHSGVTYGVFADASVRPLSWSVSPSVLEAFATIAGKEAVERVGD